MTASSAEREGAKNQMLGDRKWSQSEDMLVQVQQKGLGQALVAGGSQALSGKSRQAEEQRACWGCWVIETRLEGRSEEGRCYRH